MFLPLPVGEGGGGTRPGEGGAVENKIFFPLPAGEGGRGTRPGVSISWMLACCRLTILRETDLTAYGVGSHRPPHSHGSPGFESVVFKL